MTKVLVIEDEESFRDALEFMLTKEGFTVALAATGIDGVNSFEADQPDIILLDLMLPGMSGTLIISEGYNLLRKYQAKRVPLS
jgi:two-component system response regulator RegX3